MSTAPSVGPASELAWPNGATWARRLVELVVIAVAFGLAEKLGLLFLAPPDNISVFWPPAGFLLAVLALTPERRWPWILVAVFPTAILLNTWGTNRGIVESIGYGFADMLEAWPAAWVLVRFGGRRPDFKDLKSVLALVLGASTTGAMLSAGLGAAIATRLGTTEEYWPAFRTWAVSVLISDIVVTPFLVTWAQRGQAPVKLREVLEAVVILAALAVTTYFVFHESSRGLPLIYLPFPIVLWAALRLGPRGASLAAFSFAIVSVLLAVRGSAPLPIASSAGPRVQWMQLLVGSMALSSLALAAAIAERESNAERMRAAESGQRLILESAPIGIAVVDKDGTITQANAAYAAILGRRVAEVLGHRFRDFTHRDDLQNNLNLHHELVVQSRDRVSLEKRYVRPDGGIVHVNVHVAALRDPKGGFLSAVAMVEDVSERKRMQAKLDESQRLEAMGKLAGGVAHDFNNLLTVILAQADLARRLPGEAQSGALDDIADAARRGAGLTRQLLTFARTQIVEPKVLNLNEVLEGLMGLLRRLIAEDIEIRLEQGSDLWPVRIDASQLEQIIVNLAVNARDAMPEGGTILISTKNVHVAEGDTDVDAGVTPGEWALLTVTDDGIGMGEQTRTHVFEPFFTTKAPGKGTGLGLATVHGVVLQCGGHVAVTSAPDEGSTFRVWLPRASETSEPLAAGVEHHMDGSETVLVVEDDDAVRRVACDILRERGYVVLEANDADAALVLAAKYDKEIQLLLTDVIMPNKSGRELADALVRERPSLQVLYVSGYTGDRIAHHGVLDHGAMFLQKPYTPAELTNKVSAALKASSGSRPPPAD